MGPSRRRQYEIPSSYQNVIRFDDDRDVEPEASAGAGPVDEYVHPEQSIGAPHSIQPVESPMYNNIVALWNSEPEIPGKTAIGFTLACIYESFHPSIPRDLKDALIILHAWNFAGEEMVITRANIVSNRSICHVPIAPGKHVQLFNASGVIANSTRLIGWGRRNEDTYTDVYDARDVGFNANEKWHYLVTPGAENPWKQEKMLNEERNEFNARMAAHLHNANALVARLTEFPFRTPTYGQQYMEHQNMAAQTGGLRFLPSRTPDTRLQYPDAFAGSPNLTREVPVSQAYMAHITPKPSGSQSSSSKRGSSSRGKGKEPRRH